MSYFKFFNEEENHKGFQYKDGLNTDTLPFNDNPDDTCVPGGLYFADAKNIMSFLDNSHKFVREVFIPEGELVVPDGDDKFRAHSIKLGKRRDLDKLETWDWMAGMGVGVYNSLFRMGCSRGDLTMVKHAVSNGADITTYNNYGANVACERGHLAVVKYLVEHCGEKDTVISNYTLSSVTQNGHLEMVKYLVSLGGDVMSWENRCVRRASQNGHLDVVKYLVSLGADIKDDDNYAIRWTSLNGHLDMVKYLVSQGADVSACDNQAIKWASKNGQPTIVEYLLTQGAKLP